MKILIGINCLTSVEQVAYANHLQFFYRLGKNHPDWTVMINTPRRMSIDRMRNMSAKAALEYECDYLMFIDDDVIVPLDSLEKLIEADCDIAAGWTIIRGHPFENMAFKFDEKKNFTHYNWERGPGLVDVDAVGFSCALIKVDLLKKVQPPFFVTGPYNTEDIYFCVKARDAVPDCSIVVDSAIETAHILGPELIAPWNKEYYAEYYDKTYRAGGELKATRPDSTDGDRNAVYKEMVKNAFS
jgi:hypothetical protein